MLLSLSAFSQHCPLLFEFLKKLQDSVPVKKRVLLYISKNGGGVRGNHGLDRLGFHL